MTDYQKKLSLSRILLLLLAIEPTFAMAAAPSDAKKDIATATSQPKDAPASAPSEAKKDAPRQQPKDAAASVGDVKTIAVEAPGQQIDGKAEAPLTNTPPKKVNVSATKRIELANHATHVINLNQPAGQVLLTDPKVADVQLVTPSTLYIYGRSPGKTEIVVTGKDMVTAYRYEINIRSDYRDLENLIKGFSPHEPITIHSIPDGILLQGTVETAKTAEDIRSLAQRFVGPQGNVVNQLKIKGSTQINLRVKIAEVKRTVINQLGVNWATTPKNNLRFGLFTGRSGILNGSTPSNFTQNPDILKSAAIGMNFPFKGTDFSGLIDALSQEGLASVLAEPNLVTRSGEEASFLVGGEYPYPISQGSPPNVTITIQFKSYGISLSFLPVVIGNTISLRVRPEVSDLDDTNLVEDQSGNKIPSIKTRRAESTMEMTSGQSMIMAGLLSDRTSGMINKLPGLGDIPILGALFNSTDYKNEKTELVIVVTPYIVEPVDNQQEIILPTQGLKFANLMDMVLRGKINKPTGKASAGLVSNAGFYY
jgi:pilus assembly protein CpaC